MKALIDLPSARDRNANARRRLDRVFFGVCVTASIASVLTLVVLLVAILREGMPHFDMGFLTKPPSRKAENAGFAPALWGSIWICAVCALAALPVGVGAATFLEEYKPRWTWARRIHGFIEMNIRNLAGVPSIVYGVLGLTVFVQMFGIFGSQLAFEELQRVRFSDGSVVVGQTYEQTAETITIVGLDAVAVVRPADTVRDTDSVFMKDFRFSLNDGTLVMSEAINTFEPGKINLVNPVVIPAGGKSAIHDGAYVVNADQLSKVTSDRMFQLGDEDSLFYLKFPFGRSVLAGGLTLMLVVLPIVIISAQEALRAVPDSLREGALAAGATKWQMVSKMTLPAAVPGIMTGSILAMSRAIGEAAPVLVICGIVFIRFTPQNLMSDFTAMPLQIFRWASLPQEDFHKVAATGIIVLLAVLLVFNAAAVFIRQKFQKPLQ